MAPVNPQILETDDYTQGLTVTLSLPAFFFSPNHKVLIEHL